MTHKHRKKLIKFLCRMFYLRAKAFSRSLDILYGGLGISKLQVLIKKRIFFRLYFTLVSKPWIWIPLI
jgi:hypothetical protein